MQAPLETDLHTKGMPGMACNYLSVSESGEKNTNHFQTNPFRRPLGCNFASFPFSGVGLFFSLAFCHFPSPLGQTYVSWATSMQLLDMVSWSFFFLFVFKILTHKMQRFIDGGHCMLTWGLLNGTQNDRWMMYTRVCTSYAAHRRSYPGWAKIMAGRAVVCQVLVVSDMTFIKFNINHYSIIHWYSRFLVSSALGRPAWSGSSGCVETTSNVRTATALHVLQDSFGTSSLSILSDFKYQSVSVNHSVCRRFVQDLWRRDWRRRRWSPRDGLSIASREMCCNFFSNHSDPNSNMTSRKLLFSPFPKLFLWPEPVKCKKPTLFDCPWHLGLFEVHFVVPVPLGPCIRICSRRTRTCPAIVRSIFWWVFDTHRPCSLERHQISDFLIESMVPHQLALQPLWLSELFVSDQRSAENEVHVSQHGASTSTIASGWCWMKCGGPWSDLDAPIPCFDHGPSKRQ